MPRIPRSFRVEIHIKMQSDKTMKRVVEGLGSITRSTMISIVKYAMAKSFQKAIAERYAKTASVTPHTQQISSRRSENINFQNKTKRRQLISVATKLQHAIQTGNEGAIKRLQQRQKELVKEYTQLQSRVEGKPKGVLKSGLQRAVRTATNRRQSMHRRIIHQIIDSNAMRGHSIDSGIVVRIGNLAQLEAIEAPSITTILSGAQTRSKFRSLLRLMEFGSGVYAKPSPVLHGSRYKTAVGTWFYGPRKGQGLHFLGQKPGNFLRTQTGLPYTQDGMMFIHLFAERLNRQIFGV